MIRLVLGKKGLGYGLGVRACARVCVCVCGVCVFVRACVCVCVVCVWIVWTAEQTIFVAGQLLLSHTHTCEHLIIESYVSNLRSSRCYTGAWTRLTQLSLPDYILCTPSTCRRSPTARAGLSVISTLNRGWWRQWSLGNACVVCTDFQSGFSFQVAKD